MKKLILSLVLVLTLVMGSSAVWAQTNTTTTNTTTTTQPTQQSTESTTTESSTTRTTTEQPEITQSRSTPEIEGTTKQNAQETNSNTLWMVLLILLIIGVAVGLVIYFRKPKEDASNIG